MQRGQPGALKSSWRIFGRALFILAAVGPGTYLVGGLERLVGILFLAVLCFAGSIFFTGEYLPQSDLGKRLNIGCAAGTVVGVVSGLAAAAISLTARSPVEQVLAEGIWLGLVVGFTMGLVSGFFSFERRRETALFTGVLCCFGVALGAIEHKHWSLPITLVGAAPSGFVACVAFLFGQRIGNCLEPSFQVFRKELKNLRELVPAIVVFSIGYALLVFLFAGFFGAVWRANPQGTFISLPASPSFRDFLYFSAVTVTTLGYGDIAPRSGLARALACEEVVLGIGWITVVVAALVARLQSSSKQTENHVSERSEYGDDDAPPNH